MLWAQLNYSGEINNCDLLFDIHSAYLIIRIKINNTNILIHI